MQKKISGIYLFIFLFILPLRLAPQEKGSDAKDKPNKIPDLKKIDEDKILRIHRLNPIVIVPDRNSHQKANFENAAFITTVPIRREELGSQNLSEIISSVQGVHVKKWGGSSDFSTVSIRGSESNQVKIFLDGIPLRDSENGISNMSDFLLSGIQRIEVYRDNPPPELSGDAIGGVINIVTSEKNKANHFVQLGGGSFGAYKAQGEVQRAGKEWFGKFLIYGESEKGDFEYLNTNGTIFQNREDDFLTFRKNNDKVKLRQSALLEYRGERETSFKWKVNQSAQYKREGIPGSSLRPVFDVRQSSLLNHFYLQGEKKKFFREDLNFYIKVYNIFRQDKVSDPESQMSLGGLGTQRNFLTSGGSLGFDLKSAFQEISYFQYADFDRFESEIDIISGNNAIPSDEKIKEKSARFSYKSVVQDEIFIYNKNDRSISIILGLRLENSFDKNYPANDSLAGLSGTGENSKTYNFLNPSAGLLLRPSKKLSLKGNIRRSKRIPTFLERFGNLSQVLGNPDLVPEEALAWDAGFVAGDIFENWLDSLYLEYSFFYRKSRDTISLVQNSQNTAIYLNFEQTLVYGHELSLSLSPFDFLRLGVNYTNQTTRNLSSVSFYNGKSLPFRPEHEVSLNTVLYKRFGNYSGKIIFTMNHTSGIYRDRVNSYFYYIPVKRVFDLAIKITRRGGMGITLLLEARNIFDDRTEDISGYPVPGRSFFISNIFSF